ncbi:hypothetical protein LTS18_005139 [Coniosporium uncinatum]|uniref:Uncharacterized protein n=1 Tax=Coniosporium uncinatum TaxID=93489 RepID=A0ACC3DRG2_9PEZI|nr:hypothetical protein LTS18_005139 [Coniosporium uncinatum]
MVDVVAIVIAIISLIGALVTSLLTGYFTWWSDERKRQSEAKQLVAKYRDPILLAAKDLQSRLYNLADQNILSYMNESDEHKDLLFLYTAYLVGQYFSWVYILRRQAQFLSFSTDRDARNLWRALLSIEETFSSSSIGELGLPFMLWRGQQLAIGEVMSVNVENELLCMGYATFTSKYKKDDEFRILRQRNTETFQLRQITDYGAFDTFSLT